MEVHYKGEVRKDSRNNPAISGIASIAARSFEDE
jgi:hypothetical protein